MFSTFFIIALLAAPALADFAVNSPVLTQCKDAHISWESTQGPYNVIFTTADDKCGDAIADLGDHDGTHLTWQTALPAGAQVYVSVEDASGDEAWSTVLTVGKSDDSSCVPAALLKDVSPSAPVKSSSEVHSGSTILVIPTKTVGTVVPLATDDSTPAPEAVGAAGADPLGLGNGAPSLRQASTPVMILGGLIAVLAFSL